MGRHADAAVVYTIVLWDEINIVEHKALRSAIPLDNNSHQTLHDGQPGSSNISQAAWWLLGWLLAALIGWWCDAAYT
jgi:hypothetical protein